MVVVKTVRSGCVPRDSPPDFIPRAFASARARDVQLFSCFQTAAKEFIIRFDWMIDAGQSLHYKLLPVARPKHDVMVTLIRRDAEF